MPWQGRGTQLQGEKLRSPAVQEGLTTWEQGAERIRSPALPLPGDSGGKLQCLWVPQSGR